MEYKYEIHAHTKNTSWCGQLDAEELVKKYKAAGYSGIVITDHYSPMTFNISEFFNKKKALDHYLAGYRKAKESETEDFTVLLGTELRFYATVNDYLIYGVTEEMLYELPFLLPLYIKRASKLFRERGCIFLQAHPFRKFITRANPKHLDGVEVFNAKATKEENDNSLRWAEDINAKIKTSGSDCHRETGVGLGGIITEEPIKTNEDLLRILKSGNYKLIKNQK
ncbi:MAG: PHP domain-containing protein [Clostridia bacterium]|nr:PHP domain-containing protein [Clostridia bacterium]